jgi:hypothetical protein
MAASIGRSKALSKVSKSTFSLRESKGELKEINNLAFRGKDILLPRRVLTVARIALQGTHGFLGYRS